MPPLSPIFAAVASASAMDVGLLLRRAGCAPRCRARGCRRSAPRSRRPARPGCRRCRWRAPPGRSAGRPRWPAPATPGRRRRSRARRSGWSRRQGSGTAWRPALGQPLADLLDGRLHVGVRRAVLDFQPHQPVEQHVAAVEVVGVVGLDPVLQQADAAQPELRRRRGGLAARGWTAPPPGSPGCRRPVPAPRRPGTPACGSCFRRWRGRCNRRA